MIKRFLLLVGPVAVIAAFRDPASMTKSKNKASKAMAATTMTATAASSQPDDWFQFGATVLSSDPDVGNKYGPQDWNQVHCGNIETCVSTKQAGGSTTHPWALMLFLFVYSIAWLPHQLEEIESFHSVQ
jgi:hypothetical protein